MVYGIYLSAAGAIAEQTRQDAIANNIANVNTTGFKEDLAVVQARNAEAVRKGLPAFGTPLDAIGGTVLVAETYTKHAQGPIEVTDQPLDLAIIGEGFFPVTNGSDELYTRAGAFHRDQRGRLVMPDGQTFLADRTGKPLIVPEGNSFAVAHDGTVSVDETPVAKVDIVRFDDTRLLRKTGANLYVNGGAEGSVTGAGQIKQGALEASAVSPAAELANMITAMRSYEASMQLIKMHDQTLGDLISISRVSI